MIDKPTKTEIAYLAGFVDGEGSILIYKRKTLPGGNGSVTAPHNIRLTITNTNKEVLEWIVKRFKGNLWEYKNLRANRSKAWKWTVLCLQAEAVLQLIYPYLIIKRDEVDLALQFQALIRNRKRQHAGRRGAGNVSKEDIQRRDALADKIVLLRNSRKSYLQSH